MTANAQRQQKSDRSCTNFRERLQFAMDSAHENKLSLSKLLGVSHSTIGRWLKGSEPEAKKIAPLAAALGVNAQWLLTGDVPKRTTDELMVREELQGEYRPTSAEKIASALRKGPKGAAELMTEGELEESLIHFTALLPHQSRIMKKGYLLSIVALANELSRRLAL
jgi:transcriptional regulator with XRE-family HTH domain